MWSTCNLWRAQPMKWDTACMFLYKSHCTNSSKNAIVKFFNYPFEDTLVKTHICLAGFEPITFQPRSWPTKPHLNPKPYFYSNFQVSQFVSKPTSSDTHIRPLTAIVLIEGVHAGEVDGQGLKGRGQADATLRALHVKARCRCRRRVHRLGQARLGILHAEHGTRRLG